jgi:predicted ATP-dependent endonuclease of OLD family
MKLKQIRVDGYKNLIDCKVDLGDFNVIVGANNSGKSNFLEIFVIMLGLCMGSEKTKRFVLQGHPTRRKGVSICQLEAYKNKPLSIGITFEITISRQKWIVSYDVSVQCDNKEKDKGRFLKEVLCAKQVSKTGKATTYISRKDNKLKIKGRKERNIAKDNSALSAIKAIYPDHEGLPKELSKFLDAIAKILLTNVFSLSPQELRKTIGEKGEIDDFRVSSFDLLVAMDKINKDKKKFRIFSEAVCDILGLEGLSFVSKDIPLPSNNAEEDEIIERARYCFIKSFGRRQALLEEYSDGTFMVVAILTSLFTKRAFEAIVCLEELENCLHPAALEKLLRFLQDHAEEWPVLITTHSSYLLNGVNPEDVNVAVVDETGAAHFEKVKNSSQLRNYLNKGLLSFGDLLARDFQGYRER